MGMMSTDARKLFIELQKHTDIGQNIDNLFVAESMVYSYYVKQIASIIKQVHKKSTNPDRVNLSYYLQPVKSMIKLRRISDEWVFTDTDKRAYWLITNNYLIDDFNHDQLVQLKSLCSQRYEDIEEAVRISKKEQIYSIPYLSRIIDGIVARRAERERKLNNLRTQFQTGAEIRVNQHSPLEMASMVHNWQEQLENHLLQERVSGLYKDEEVVDK